MIYCRFKHGNTCLIHFKSALLYCFKKPYLSSLQGLNILLLLFQSKWVWGIQLLIIEGYTCCSSIIFSNYAFNSSTNLFYFICNSFSNPNSSFHILSFIIILISSYHFKFSQFFFQFKIFLFQYFPLLLHRCNYL